MENGLEFDEKIVVSEDTLFILEAIDKAKSIYLSDFNFYWILEEHSLSRFNEQVLGSEVAYERKISKVLSAYPVTYEKKLLLTRIKLNGLCTLVRRYYGAKVIRNEITIRSAVKQLKKTVDKEDDQYLLRNNVNKLNLPPRYRILSKFLCVNLYCTALYFDVLIDRMKKVSWK